MIAAMAQRRQQSSGQGGGTIGRKHCPVCHRQVLSAYRGEVTAVGKSDLERVKANGDVVGRCGDCGAAVTWIREVSRPR